MGLALPTFAAVTGFGRMGAICRSHIGSCPVNTGIIEFPDNLCIFRILHSAMEGYRRRACVP